MVAKINYQRWENLKAQDIVDIIAPASFCPPPENSLPAVKDTLKEWGLVPRIAENIYGKDLLCANTDEQRFLFLKEALLNTESKAVWCLRGGYGCTRLIPFLKNINPPKHSKLFIGFSDITALHIFLQDQWGWATLHGPSARQVAIKDIHEDNIIEIKDFILGKQTSIEFNHLTPMNKLAEQNRTVTSVITGGNLCLVQTSIGTSWQINAAHKILFLEEVNERGYRVDRMLEHLEQAGIFNDVSAIIFGDFIGGKEVDGTNFVEPVLKRFAEQANFPVLRCLDIGHGKTNRPLPFGIPAKLGLGTEASLTIKF